MTPHVVLSTLYQEKMITEQEVEELKPAVLHWDRLVQIQSTKPPDVVKRTAELLSEVGDNVEGNHLKGRWLHSVDLLFIMIYVIFTMDDVTNGILCDTV